MPKMRLSHARSGRGSHDMPPLRRAHEAPLLGLRPQIARTLREAPDRLVEAGVRMVMPLIVFLGIPTLCIAFFVWKLITEQISFNRGFKSGWMSRGDYE